MIYIPSEKMQNFLPITIGFVSVEFEIFQPITATLPMFTGILTLQAFLDLCC